jgi:uncharacterized membrane protein HdeD (DUF308 family)
MIFAAFALADGLISLAGGIGGRAEGKRPWAPIARGLVGVLVGLLFLLMPYVTTLSYALASLALLASGRSSRASSSLRLP